MAGLNVNKTLGLWDWSQWVCPPPDDEDEYIEEPAS